MWDSFITMLSLPLTLGSYVVTAVIRAVVVPSERSESRNRDHMGRGPSTDQSLDSSTPACGLRSE